MMAILDPVKVVIDNYPEGEIEYLEVPKLKIQLGYQPFFKRISASSKVYEIP